MNLQDIIHWMLTELELQGCLYQDDVVDFIIKSNVEEFLKENSKGNQVLNTQVLNAFKKLTKDNVVWVAPDFYWRFRVDEDEEGRIARG